MKKEEFLILLLARLIERGVPENIAQKETEHVRTYLTESGMEELDISLDEMADGIISMLNDSSDSEKSDDEIIIPILPQPASKEGSVSDELEAAIAAISTETVPEEENAKQEVAAINPIPIIIEPDPLPEISDSEESSDDSSQQDDPIKESHLEPDVERTDEPADPLPVTVAQEVTPEPILESEPIPEPIPEQIPDTSAEPEIEDQSYKNNKPVHILDEDDTDVEEFFPYDKKKRMKKNDSEKKQGNEWLYVAILVITIPIVVALLAVSLVLYLGFWVVLALAMIACIAVLVVFVTAGAVVSLVGIVYGVVQLITGQIPVGMFEVGLGIIVGAATMFVGILVYNFAVRFIPFGMKLLAKLFRSGFRAVRSGYQALKGAVNNI